MTAGNSDAGALLQSSSRCASRLRFALEHRSGDVPAFRLGVAHGASSVAGIRTPR
jgi:hypothetical protein